MQFILSTLIAYLLGSVSFSYLAGKLLKGIDIRSHGSGNAGATNTLRVLGIALR
jgi:glycerol-3-phosphate acyltransferase PlsY